MEILNRQFGLAIAYLLPRFIALLGLAPFAPVGRWLAASRTNGESWRAPDLRRSYRDCDGNDRELLPMVPGGSDPLAHRRGGIPLSNARALEERPAAFNSLVESHYRYFQFYANTLVAVIWTYAIYRALGTSPHLSFGTDFGMLILCAVLFAGSRDTLSKYRNRSKQLVGQTPQKE